MENTFMFLQKSILQNQVKTLLKLKIIVPYMRVYIGPLDPKHGSLSILPYKKRLM